MNNFSKSCPYCHSKDIVKDYHRDEKYCNECGLVLTQSYDYNGDSKVDGFEPYGYSVNARRGIHVLHRDKSVNNTPASKIMNYKHNLSNSKLMIKGHKGRFKN